MKIAIVGGGIMGVTLAYYLSKQGAQVEIFEASPLLGGLAGPLTLPDGTDVDRFYHVMLTSDEFLMGLCQELGLTDQLRFNTTRTGFYWRGKLYSMNNVVEFMRFPPLGWVDRFRLGVTVLAAQTVNDWHRLEGESVEKWLLKYGGKTTYENIWRPMLRAKFDGGFDSVPATWMWSRLVRIKSMRKGVSQKESSGHLLGGYITLLKAMLKRIEAAGGCIHLRTPVQEVVIEGGGKGGDKGGQAVGLRVNGEVRRFDKVAVTMQTPVFQKLIPGAPKTYHDFLGKTEYLGIVCPIMVLDKPLTGYWTVNITDDRFPFTGIVETTTYIDPKDVAGHHLVYLPKYTQPGSKWQKMSDEEIRQIWLKNLKEMLPDFDTSSVRYFLVHRERYVEPLHPLNSSDLIPSIQTPVANLFLATTAQIYPALTNGESVSRHASQAAQAMLQT